MHVANTKEEFIGLGKFFAAFYSLHHKFIKNNQDNIIKNFFDMLEESSSLKEGDQDIDK